ncbi:glycosyltransferase family 4 protein [Clostridium sp. CS001]|uniref:glycosyltransferase family 4 protein n=1 Tax=Clostridium sp. CS001 TaxID=2880648 RepID=UPI001CF2D95B|nr:glycosyltransferase family 4 protein [Clostridium sp. CS001]MCB2289988.1 glycosyltransferase family 4 protein [Clostridium sp. CS001]
MNIAIVTNIRAPYRKLQIEEFAQNNQYNINVYYTNSGYEDRNWNVPPINNVKEIYLKKILSFGKYGFLNKGLLDIIHHNDTILIGGYEMPSYIILMLLCKRYNKKSVLLFDGVSVDKIRIKKFNLLQFFKRNIIKGFDYYFANGEVSKKYFIEIYNVKDYKVYNQFLSVDGSVIKVHKMIENEKVKYRLKNCIDNNERVIVYSGRLISIKRVDLIIKAISLLDRKEHYRVVILGDGVEKYNLLELAKIKNIKVDVMGFTSDQEELFIRYNLGDLLILPSDVEPWGLVVNEAMAADLPVIVSDICGCSLDLIHEGVNGYTFKKGNEIDLSNKIRMIFENDYKKMGKRSGEIIERWTFSHSKKNFEKIVKL